MSHKLYNPKAHAPAVYIPAWLIQIPNNQLSFAAKCLYGRLAQWSNEKGDVFRSYKQLAEEIGSTQRSVNSYLRELRNCGLIGTLQPQAGGLNHFVFYDHPWMNEQINQFLCYRTEPENPKQNLALPQAESCSTPEQNLARINKKEIKINKKDLKPSGDFGKSPGVNEENVPFLSTYEANIKKQTDYKDDMEFMAFYESYPNKQKPHLAYREFLKLNPDGFLLQKIIQDVKKRIANNWKNRAKSKIPYPSSYLESREWEGDIVGIDSTAAKKNDDYFERVVKGSFLGGRL